MNVIDADKSDSRAPRLVDKNLVKDFRNRNFFVVDVEVDFLLRAFSVVKFDYAMRPSEHVQGNIAIRRQSSASIFNCSPGSIVVN